MNRLDEITYQKVRQSLKKHGDILKIKSPGRINLIGEHIDYNGGNVLPAAIDKYITFSFRKNNTNNKAFILSENFKEGFEFLINNDIKTKGWINYLLGVISLLRDIKSNQIKGFDCIIESNLPVGSGISSSAALLCGFAKGLHWLFDLKISDITLVKLCQKAERIFSGANVGVMDQFTVVMGKKNHLLFLNCKTLQYKQIPADFSPYGLLLLNTNVTHSLGDSAYNTRRKECETALQIIQKSYPHIKTLVEVDSQMIEQLAGHLGKDRVQRATFVSQEQQRVLQAIQTLQEKDFGKLGRLLNESHKGLQHLYKVSCDELDFLAKFAEDDKRILGGRMMGGGFGGCTINLVHKDDVEQIIKYAKEVYKKTFGIDLTAIVANTFDGVKKCQ